MLDGSLRYELPLTIPPGRNGLQPSLSLMYSSRPSQETNLFGRGWSVSIPYIERKNYTGSENLYSTSAFYSSLSGDLASTTDAAVFKPKVDDGDFLQYSFSTSTGWTVTDKRGTVYKFGVASSTQQVDPTNSQHVFRWMLQEIRDKNDNYVSYSYTKDSNQIYPDLITYTNHPSSTGPFDIHFTKELRNDIATSTAEGFTVTTRYRISEVKAEVSDSWVRKYALGYGVGDNGERDMLVSVTESGNDGAIVLALPTSTFSYQAATDSWSDASWDIPQAFVGADYQDNGTRIADVNGDGLPDLLQRHATDPTGSVWLNTGSGWTYNASWTIPVPLNEVGVVHPGSLLIDINGDGKIDIAKYTVNATSSIHINNGTGWSLSSSTVPVAFAKSDGSDNGVRVADVNGDGLPDLVRNDAGDGGAGNKVYINNGATWTYDSSWSVPEPTLAADGETDVGTRFVDVNGDGLADVARKDESVNKVYLNDGNHGWTLSSSTIPVEFMNAGDDMGTRFEDINGDGLVDLINSQEVNDTGVYLNTGAAWVYDATSTIPFKIVDFVSSVYVDPGTRIADVDGDGLADLLQYREGQADKVYLRNGVKPDLLLTVTNPQGGVTTVTYKASPEYGLNPSLPLVLDTVQKVAYNDLVSASWDTEYSYQGGLYYATSSAIRDRKFAGFKIVSATDDLGFVTKQYFHQGDTSSSTIGEYDDHISKIGKVFRTEAYDNGGNLYAKTTSKWDRYDRGDGASFVKLAQAIDFSYDGDSDHKEKAESFTWSDTRGTLGEKIEWGRVTGGDDGTFTDTGTDKFTTTLGYATTSVIALLSQETTLDQSSNKVRERKIYYDGLSLGSVDKGNPTKEERWKVSSTYVDTEKTYTNYGLVATEKDPRDKTTTYAYDALNLYAATSTNPLSHVTGRTFDYSSGKTIQTTDPNGRVFETLYDSLDRLKEEKQPDLTSPSTLVTKAAYTYTDTGFPTKVQKTAYLGSATSTDSYLYLDGFGKKLEKRTEAEAANTFAVRDYQYDERGLLKTESLPYFSTSTAYTATTTPAAGSLLIRYAYDPLRRVKTITTNVGTTTNAYDDWKLTVTDPEGNLKDLTKDAYGNLAEVVEHNGASSYTTAYEYDGNQKLTKLTDADGNVRNFTYDGLGRRLTAQDLHDAADGTFGSWSYSFDDAGNLSSFTDPKSQTVDFTYDDLNRTLTENYTGAAGTEISYSYDACTEGIGRLCAATSTAATATFAYNPLGLTAAETKIVSGTAYTTSYTYDRQGNQTNVTYPDNSEVRFSHNAAGQLESVAQKESGGSFADLVVDFDYAPNGKVSYKEFANGVVSTYTYDDAKLYRLTRILTTPPGIGGGDADSIYWDGSQLLFFGDEQTYAPDTLRRLLALEGESEVPGEVLGVESPETSDPGLPSSPEPEASPAPEPLLDEPITPPASDEAPPMEPPVETPAAELETTPAATSTDATATTTVGTATTTEPAPAPIPDHLKLQAAAGDLLGHKEFPDGVVKYAYRTNVRIDTAPASAETVTAAEAKGLQITGEVAGKRTKYSRTFATNDPNVFVSEFIAGDPQYYQDEAGEWWQADYATTTREAYDLQTEPRPEEKTVWTRILDFVSSLIFREARAATTTFYPDPSPESSSVDGYIRSSDSDWSGARSATAGDALEDSSAGAPITGAKHFSSNYSILRSFLLFDTAALPDADTIVSVTLSIYVTSVQNGDNDGDDFINVFTTTPASNTAIVLGDFDQVGSTAQSTAVDVGSLTTNAYNDFVLNATGRGNVSTTGVTKFGFREGHDINNNAISNSTENEVSIRYAEYTGTASDPKLVVVHTGAPTAPTGLLTEGQTNPSYVLDSTPEFSAIFNDPDGSDTAVSYQIQVATSSAFASVYWDSTKTALSPAASQGARSADISYAGSSLVPGTTYYWRIKFWDQLDVAGSWSAGTDYFALFSQPTGAIQNIYFTYDKVGNVTELADYSEIGTAKTIIFGYDDLNRLTSASTTAASSTPFSEIYAYSAIGNLTSKSDQGSYTYAETGTTNPQAATAIGSLSLAYDTNGNLISMASSTYAWDWRNRLATSTVQGVTTTYAYDHTTDRVKKTLGATSTIYANDLYNTDGTTKTKHVFAGGELIATIETVGATSTVRYVHADHLGGVNAITDAEGDVVEVADYYPFGEQRIDIGAFEEQRRFTGHEYDASADLTYANARYYEQNIGRWLSQDPVFLVLGDANQIQQIAGQSLQGMLADPQQLNGYSYVRNNPVALTDPTGNVFAIPIAIATAPEWVPVLAAGAGVVAIGTMSLVRNSERLREMPFETSRLVQLPDSSRFFDPTPPNFPPGGPSWRPIIWAGLTVLGAGMQIYQEFKNEEDFAREQKIKNDLENVSPSNQNHNIISSQSASQNSSQSASRAGNNVLQSLLSRLSSALSRLSALLANKQNKTK